MKTFLIVTLAISSLGAWAISCQSQTLGKQATRTMVSIEKRYPCEGLAIPVHTISVDTDLGCSLTRLALSEISDGSGVKIGFPRSDTANVKESDVAWINVQDSHRKVVEAYWSVVLTVGSKDAALGVRIEQNGRVRVQKSEVPSLMVPRRSP